MYFLHRINPEQIQEDWKVMKDLVNEGKVRHIGLSEAPPKIIRQCHAIHPVACVQME